jgi:hypothetical protein
MNEIIKKTGEEVMDTAANSVENTAAAPAPILHSRRRLVQAGLAAAPVVLALSGRSAMATGTATPAALSPIAWLSANPVNGGTVSASRSPRASGASGIVARKWKPVELTATFPSVDRWPATAKPFLKITKVTRDTDGKSVYTEYPFAATEFKNYTGLTYKYVDKNNNTQDSGWGTGTVAAWLDSRSLSQILISEASADTLKANVAAAYLSALLAEDGGPAYLLSSTSVRTLYESRTLGTTVVSDANMRAFFKQTLA